jgi:hypothetical protein
MSVYVDKINGKRVGAVMEYLIVGIQTYTNLDTKEDTLTPVRTQSTSLVYRVPYYASFEGIIPVSCDRFFFVIDIINSS